MLDAFSAILSADDANVRAFITKNVDEAFQAVLVFCPEDHTRKELLELSTDRQPAPPDPPLLVHRRRVHGDRLHDCGH